MATNPTKDPLEFLEKQLNDANHHLTAAQNRLAHGKIKQQEKIAKFKAKGKEYKQPLLGDTNSEIENLKIKISNIEYCIEAVKEKREKERFKKSK